MDDDYFDDLLNGAEIEDSSQESLTSAAANLYFCDSSNNEGPVENLPILAPSDAEAQAYKASNLQEADEADGNVYDLSREDDTVNHIDDLQPQQYPNHRLQYMLIRCRR